MTYAMGTKGGSRTWLAAAAVTIAATAMIVPAPVVGASPPANRGVNCRLFADDPYWDGAGHVVATGGRIGCGSIRTVTVVLRQDRPWLPDRTLASDTDTRAVVILDAKKYCAGGDDDMKVFTETRTNTGGKVQSGRLLTTC